jgi:hypothetical protein
MIPYLDILKKDETGILWLGAASSMQDAFSQIRAYADSGALQYVIFNSRTGVRTAVDPSGPVTLVSEGPDWPNPDGKFGSFAVFSSKAL